MEKTTLGPTGLDVTRLCFGTMTLGGQADEATSQRLIDRCLEAGLNFFDTANVYNQGRSEELTGKFLKGRRAGVVLASKVRGAMGDGPDDKGLSRAAILKAIDESLRRLQTDYLDIYYLHQPDYDVPIDETLEAMEEVIRAGKVRYPAVSNYASWQVAQIHCIAEKRQYHPPHISQHMYNLLARGVEQEFVPMARQYKVAGVVYNPLAGGLLTGKQTAERPLPGSRFDSNQMYLDRYWHPAYFEAVEKLRAIAAQSGRSLVSLALNWLLHHTQTSCIILGASSVEQLNQNLAAAEEGSLPEETVRACDQIWQSLRGITPKYNR